jgi:hypothetical protein
LRQTASQILACDESLREKNGRGLPARVVADANFQLGVSYESTDADKAFEHLEAARRLANDGKLRGAEAITSLEIAALLPRRPSYSSADAIRSYELFSRAVALDDRSVSPYVKAEIRLAKERYAQQAGVWSFLSPTVSPQLAGIILETEMWLYHLEANYDDGSKSDTEWARTTVSRLGMEPDRIKRVLGLRHYPQSKTLRRLKTILDRIRAETAPGLKKEVANQHADILDARWRRDYPNAIKWIE